MRLRTGGLSFIICILTVWSVAAGYQKPKAVHSLDGQAAEWPLYGRDLAGSHYNPHEKALTPETVSRLKVKWIFETGGDVSSQPVVTGGVAYFGSWDGKEYAVEAATGKKIWEFDTGGSPSRSGAAYAEGALYFGDITGHLYALDAATGKQKWKVKIDPHRVAVATSSPIFYKGRVYIGVASHEEGAILGNANYECCTFRGGVGAFDATTGNQVWRYYTLPDPPSDRGKDEKGRTIYGPAGAAVWSTVSIHPETNRLYLTSGNQYTNPETKFSDAIIALDLNSGKSIWSFQGFAGDMWNFDCLKNPSKCSEDYDFGSIPLAFKGAGGKQLI
ncbi:MAG: PQQ-binding-like beta-propeller repeat protein, partial [Blastocatellia bacterium]